MNIFSSPYIVVPFVAWFIAQLLKFALKAVSGDFSFRYFYKSGEMPSSHTSIVIALLVVLGFIDGVESSVFGVASVFALIVVYDALNVRRAVGEQGGVLTRLMEISRTPRSEREKIKIREVLGHTPIEVLAGGTIGLVVSFILMYSHWPSSWQQVINTVNNAEWHIYFYIFAVVAVAGVVANRLFNRHGFKKLPTSKRIMRAVRVSFISPAVVGLLSLWLQREEVRFFNNKVWILLSLIWLVVGAIVSYVRVFRGAKAALAEERSYFKRVKHKIRSHSQKKRRHKRKK